MINPIAKSYARLIKAGRRTITDVPAELVADVKAILGVDVV